MRQELGKMRNPTCGGGVKKLCLIVYMGAWFRAITHAIVNCMIFFLEIPNKILKESLSHRN